SCSSAEHASRRRGGRGAREWVCDRVAGGEAAGALRLVAANAGLRLVVGLVAALLLLGLAGCGKGHHAPGVEIVLKAVGPPVSGSDLDRSVDIMRQRLARLSGRGSVTYRAGSKLIVVRLEGRSDAAGLLIDMTATAQLEFYDLTPSLLPP